MNEFTNYYTICHIIWKRNKLCLCLCCTDCPLSVYYTRSIDPYSNVQATCSNLGVYDGLKYEVDPDCVECVKDLIRFLRRDDDNHEVGILKINKNKSGLFSCPAICHTVILSLSVCPALCISSFLSD